MRKGTNPVVNSAAVLLLAGAMVFPAQTVAAQVAIDNSTLSSSEFRKHERTFGLVYGGDWESTDDYPEDPEFGGDNDEFDLYAGIRPTLGDMSFDLSYCRYVYDDTQRITIP